MLKSASMEKKAMTAVELALLLSPIAGLGSFVKNTVDKPKEVGSNFAKSIGSTVGATAGVYGGSIGTDVFRKSRIAKYLPKLVRSPYSPYVGGVLGALLGGVGTHKVLNSGRG